MWYDAVPVSGDNVADSGGAGLLFAGACERVLAALFCKKQSSINEGCSGLLSWVMGYAQSVLEYYWEEGSLMLCCGVISFVAPCLSFDVGVDVSSGV